MKTTVAAILSILLLISSWSCSSSDSVDTLEPTSEETPADSISEDEQSSEDNTDEGTNEGGESDGVRTEIEGFTLTDEAVEVTEYELVLDTIPGTNEIVVDVSNVVGKSSSKPPGPIKVGTVFMDRAKGFLVEVVEIKDGIATVVDASMDKFYKAGSIQLAKWYDELEDREFEYQPIDLSFDFEKDFVPHPNIHMVAGGKIQYRPSITGALNFSDKVFYMHLGNLNQQDTLKINGSFKVGISGAFNLDEDFLLGSINKKVRFGHIPAVIKLSLFYRPSLYGAIDISDSFSLDYEGSAEAVISYDSINGFNTNASYIKHRSAYDGFYPAYKYSDNYSMTHGVYAKFQVLFFNVVGGESEFGLRYDVEHGSSAGDWHNRSSLNAEVSANIKEKIFNRVEDYARLDFESKATARTIPNRVIPINEIGNGITETFQFFVTRDYVDPFRITYQDYLRGVSNVQIHCFGGDYFGNGATETIITTDENGFAQITASQIGIVRNEGLPSEYISYDNFLRLQFEIRDGYGERINGGLNKNDF